MIRMVRAVVLIAIVCTLTPASAAVASIPDCNWFPDEIVASGVSQPSGPEGASIAFTPPWSPWQARDECHVVYPADGDIWWCWRDAGGWSSPQRLTNEPADSRNPRLAFGRSHLIVVWEDDRTGHPEVWARMWNGSSWSPAECLTSDAAESRSPAVAGADQGAYVVWEEGPVGSTSIRARYWTGTQWRSTETVAAGSGSPAAPTISAAAWLPYSVAWSDRRHGDAEIYIRRGSYGSWMPERRVTDLAGNCARPCLQLEPCCSDFIQSSAMIAFENDASGIPEVWVASCMEDDPPYVRQLSAGGDRASIRPSAGGYAFSGAWGPWGGWFGRFFVVWTEDGAAGEREHWIAHFPDAWSSDGQERIATTGIAWAVVGSIAGSPHAPIMLLRTERTGGVDRLVARPGEVLGCSEWVFGGPEGGILLGPEGFPDNTLSVVDACEGSGPVEDVEVEVFFDDILDSHLRWDSTQEHPLLPMQSTGPDGTTTFAIRGGGCWPDGFVSVRNFGLDVLSWRGAKSPDVDGDCAVGSDDLAYVSSKVGTSDFCADLDGSGLVGPADVAIVMETMGDLCTGIAGLAERDAARIDMTVGPNPSPDAVVLRFHAPDPRGVSIRVADAGGRIVRDLGWIQMTAGSGSADWDGRDSGGRPVPAGVYFLRLSTSRGELDRSVLILR